MKIGFVSLGCPKNLVDSEVMLGLVQQAGHDVTADAADADVLVVNTCAFIDSAKQESVDAILEMAELKKTGALPEAGRHRLPGRALPRRAAGRRSARSTRCSARAKCPTSSARSPAPAAGARCRRAGHACSGAPPRLRRRGAPTPRALPDVPLRRRHAAHAGHAEALRLREGGRRLRLHVRVLHHPDAARPLPQPHAESIVAEARRLAARGVRELLLISQDTTFYGVDRGERGALARLLRELNRVDGLEWIRLLYLYPTTITRRRAGRDGRVREGLQVRRPAAAARVAGGAEAHEAPRHRHDVPAPARPDPRRACRASRCARRSSSGSRARPPRSSTSSRRSCADVAFDHVGVFTYSHEEGTTRVRAAPTTCPRG